MAKENNVTSIQLFLVILVLSIVGAGVKVLFDKISINDVKRVMWSPTLKEPNDIAKYAVDIINNINDYQCDRSDKSDFYPLLYMSIEDFRKMGRDTSVVQSPSERSYKTSFEKQRWINLACSDLDKLRKKFSSYRDMKWEIKLADYPYYIDDYLCEGVILVEHGRSQFKLELTAIYYNGEYKLTNLTYLENK